MSLTPLPAASTVVTFHFNVAATLPYVCRLLKKVTTAGFTVWARVPESMLPELDVALWTTMHAEDFLPHAQVHDAAAAHSPVLLSAGPAPQRPVQVLVNLLPDGPPDVARFERVVEIVGGGDAARLAARQRWRHYQHLGLQPTSYDAAGSSG